MDSQEVDPNVQVIDLLSQLNNVKAQEADNKEGVTLDSFEKRFDILVKLTKYPTGKTFKDVLAIANKDIYDKEYGVPWSSMASNMRVFVGERTLVEEQHMDELRAKIKSMQNEIARLNGPSFLTNKEVEAINNQKEMYKAEIEKNKQLLEAKNSTPLPNSK